MRKIVLFLLLLTNSLLSQTNYSDVMDLLVNNKPNEAKELFDKKFSTAKTNSIELLLLETLIDQQLGKIYFDETFIKNIEKLPNADKYVQILCDEGFFTGDINTNNLSELTLKKLNYLVNSEVYNTANIVNYRAGFIQKKIYNKDYEKYFSKLNQHTNWSYCGIFENLNGSGLNTEYEPEIYPKADKKFDANSNGKVGWYIPKHQLNEGYHLFYNEVEYGTGIVYAQSFATIPESKKYLLTFGAANGLKIFVNDVEVYLNNDLGATNSDAYQLEINLPKGINRILFKIEQSGMTYFSSELSNLDHTLINGITYSDSYLPYNKSTLEELKPLEKEIEIETYFRKLWESDPENLLYRYLLFKTYYANKKKDLCLIPIDGLNEKYPNSQFVGELFIEYYNLTDQDQKKEEVLKNIENAIPDSFFNLLLNTNNAQKLKDLSLEELEKKMKIAKGFKSEFLYNLYDYLVASRNSDKNKMLSSYKKIVDESSNMSILLRTYLSVKYKFDNKKSDYINSLKSLYKKTKDHEVFSSLLYLYEKSNDLDAIKNMILDDEEKQPYVNENRNTSVAYYKMINQYSLAIEKCEENLKNFPYSYKTMGEMAEIYALKQDKENAIKYYQMALSHDEANSSYRKKLDDLLSRKDEIESLETPKPYDYIKEKRGSNMKTDTGVVVLLDEMIANIVADGVVKNKVKLIYEITSTNGIERMKEYSLNTGSLNILKSEIVKKNNSLVPAEKGDNLLVFPNLEVGDVLFVEYEYTNTSYGRFYKDVEIGFFVSGENPTEQTNLTIIQPESTKLNYKFSQNPITPEISKIGDKKVISFKATKTPALEVIERNAPSYYDNINSVYISTIENWKEISNWYADLVKKEVKFDKTTETAYNKIFPNGISGLNDNAKAEKIYKYICENITYSSLDFRQSGYVPQKPSKTLTSKLGDCKDLSTLFVTLAEKAGVKSNLVLVLTNDNGFKTLLLPSRDFNHCIVRAILDGKETFIEMTDKYLPFKAIPSSLYKANALIIHFDKSQNENSKLISLPISNGIKNIRKTVSNVTILDDKKVFENKHYISGSGKSYYNEIFATETTEDVRKKEFEDYLNRVLNKSIVYQEAKVLTTDQFSEKIDYLTKFIVNEKNQKLGATQIINIPFLDEVYTKDLISEEKRNYPINYLAYENTNEYLNEINFTLPATKKFTDLPTNKILNYKGHKYALEFKLIKPNVLQIKRKVTTGTEEITTAEYPEFKKYIEEVLNTEEQVIGFK